MLAWTDGCLQYWLRATVTFRARVRAAHTCSYRHDVIGKVLRGVRHRVLRGASHSTEEDVDNVAIIYDCPG